MLHRGWSSTHCRLCGGMGMQMKVKVFFWHALASITVLLYPEEIGPVASTHKLWVRQQWQLASTPAHAVTSIALATPCTVQESWNIDGVNRWNHALLPVTVSCGSPHCCSYWRDRSEWSPMTVHGSCLELCMQTLEYYLSSCDCTWCHGSHTVHTYISSRSNARCMGSLTLAQ